MSTSGTTLGRFGYRQELSPQVSTMELIFYGLIFMVPIAPFAIFGAVFQASGGMVALAYAIAVGTLVFTATSYQQMVRAFPLSGSVYNYTGRGIGAPIGFLSGWAILLDYLLVPTLLYVVAAFAMNAALPAVPVWIFFLAFVLVNTVINLRGIRMSMTFTKVFIAGELAVLAVYLGVGVYALSTGVGRFSVDAFFDPATFTWPLIFSGVSIAVLSLLGFDGIAMLVEESKHGSAQIGRAMRWALVLAGVLFIAQVWVAAMLTPDPAALIEAGDPTGTAFYDSAQAAGGEWLRQVTTVATALAWGIADTLVAQIAVSRLLFAMARDRQMPAFLARVSPKRLVPANATVLVAVLSTGLGLWMASRDDGITLLSALINMGAMFAFVMLHVSVIAHYLIRNRSRDLLRHLLIPLVGAAILGYIIYSANILAQRVGLIWLAVGVVALLFMYATGNRPKFTTVAPAPETQKAVL
jgi:amino acid transporter